MIRAIFLICVFACGCNSTDSDTNVVRLAVTDVEGIEQLQIEFGAFRDLLEDKTDLEFEFFPVTSRTAAVEALAHGKVDLVLTGPAEYVMFQSRTPVEPVIALVRADYYSVVAVLKQSSITELAHLRDKKVALGSIGSTSKHLAPLAMISEAGIDPVDEIEAIHVPIRTGWEMLQRGQVDAFATTSDKFALLLELEDESLSG